MPILEIINTPMVNCPAAGKQISFGACCHCEDFIMLNEYTEQGIPVLAQAICLYEPEDTHE